MPFDTPHDTDSFGDTLENINPDIQYFNDQACLHNTGSCRYFTEDTFNDMCNKSLPDKNYFSMICLNIRSVTKNLSDFSNYLDSLSHKFPVIGITETWLSDLNLDNCHLEGYSSENAFRSNRNGGGVSLLIDNHLNYKRRTDLQVFCPEIESLFIEIPKESLNSHKNTVIGIIYRPPGTDIESFLTIIDDMLNKIRIDTKNIFIMGDFNINLLNSESHLPTSQFIDIMYSKSMFPLISRPTRITDESATLIDNIFTNHIFDSKLTNGIFLTDISDHFPLFSVVSDIKLDYHKQYFKYRPFSEHNKSDFFRRLNDTNWDDVLNCNDGRVAFTTFHEKFCQLFETCFPVKDSYIKYTNRKQWLTFSLKKSIKNKNNLYVKFKRDPSIENRQQYKTYKTRLNSILRKCEREYFNTKIEQCKLNAKKSWSVIKGIINKNVKRKPRNHFVINDSVTDDGSLIASKFNVYFTKIGPNLARSIPNTDRNATDFLNHSVAHSIFLGNTDRTEIKSIVASLKESSPGWDDIPAKCLKHNSELLSDIFTHLINLSISQGIFPDELKIAKVVPLYKSDDPSHFNNYRPISILSVFSKIYERVLHLKLSKFINANGFLHKYQFGFREKYNTSLALLTLVDKISSAINNNEFVVGLFLDFKKAFDTINHEILFEKLYKYGIRGVALDWIKDYLSLRKQYVCYDNFTSDKRLITCGVPQGSILGPLLFLLYINDLPNCSNILFSLLFADDTNMFLVGKNVDDLIQTMNIELDKIVKWLECNKLSLNTTKTKFMIFSSKRRHPNHHSNIIINGEDIEKVSAIKFLGVTLNCNLSWLNHIQKTKVKVAKNIGVICKARRVLQQSTLALLYNTFIQPYLIYCIEVWGSASDSHILPLIRIQKKAIRIVCSVPPRTHTYPLFVSLNILNIRKLYQYMATIFMFKHHHQQLPDHCNDLFTSNAEIHDYNTRQRSMLHVPVTANNYQKRTIRFMGVTLWNRLCNIEINRNRSVFTFKKHLKKFLLSNSLL